MSNGHPSAVDLERRLNRIYDHLYANAPVRTPQAIANEVGKILRTISFIESSNSSGLTNADLFELTEILSKDLASARHKELMHRLATEIRDSFHKMNSQYELYHKKEKIVLSEFDIAYTCTELRGISVSSSRHDVFGDAMEVFRSYWAKSHGGQFFTDQRVTDLAMHLLRFNPLKGDDLVDICAGTGGFLLAGIRQIRNLLEKESNISDLEKKLERIAAECLKGQEIDQEICDIGNATLSSQIGQVSKIIKSKNSLKPAVFDANNDIKYDSHHCVATNPPFGTKITIKDIDVLKSFQLSRANTQRGLFGDSTKLVQRAPDVLFLEQNLRLLIPGKGRLAIVLPYQILSGPQTLFVRQWLLKNAQVMAVVDLPNETFQPHTGTKACLVLLRRRMQPLNSVNLNNDPPIFMSKPRWIGHDRRGNPVFQRTSDGGLSQEILSDFPEVEQAYSTFLNGKNPSTKHADSFLLEAKKIEAREDLRLDAHFHSSSRTSDSIATKIRQKSSQWTFKKIHEVTHRIFYPGRFTRHYVSDEYDSVPFLGGSNITQLLIETDKRLSINNPKLKELIVEPGWVLVTRSGSTGIVALVPQAWKKSAISEHVIRIVPDPKKLPPEYIYAFLRTKYAQSLLNSGIYGSVIDEITPDHIGDIEIPIPKDRKALLKVVKSIGEGELSRQNAIERLYEGVETVENLMKF